MTPESPFSRRDALKAIGTGAVTVSSMGTIAGDSDPGDGVRVTVGYRHESGARAARDAASEVVHDFSFDAITVVVDATAIDGLRRREDVRYAERDLTYEIVAQELPWGIDRVDAEVAHANGDTGSGADVAILDTGIDQFHSDLAGNLGEGVAFEAGVQSNKWQDDNGHGTHCAGIADAIDNDRGVVGVSTTATLHAVKVLSGAGVGLTSDIAMGIEWVADQGYDVASMSFGGSSESDAISDAVNYAHGEGVTLVAAAGNSGPCEDCVGWPAKNSKVVAISATTDHDELADFSSQGPEIELAAPGDGIYSTFLGGYATLSGTSMACPHVSGAAGQLAANGYSNDEIRQQLESSAEDVGLSSNEQGSGLLDVAAALGYDSSDDLSGSSDTDPGSGDGTAPTGSIDGVTEVESPSPHAEFDVSWSAHDDDGDLSSVALTLTDLTDGGTEDSASVDVSGTDASGTTRLQAHKDDGSGNDYEVDLEVTDSAGNTATDAASVTESEESSSSNGEGDGGGNSGHISVGATLEL